MPSDQLPRGADMLNQAPSLARASTTFSSNDTILSSLSLSWRRASTINGRAGICIGSYREPVWRYGRHSRHACGGSDCVSAQRRLSTVLHEQLSELLYLKRVHGVGLRSVHVADRAPIIGDGVVSVTWLDGPWSYKAASDQLTMAPQHGDRMIYQRCRLSCLTLAWVSVAGEPGYQSQAKTPKSVPGSMPIACFHPYRPCGASASRHDANGEYRPKAAITCKADVHFVAPR